MTDRTDTAHTGLFSGRVAILASLTVSLLAIASPGSALASEPCLNEGIREAQRSTFLPDCRAYEQVSPASKDGADVMAVTSKTVAAPAGGAVAFASLAGFGDVQGTSVDAQYLARRTGIPGTSGWATHGITPAGHAHTFGALASSGDVSTFEAAFTPDLSRAVYRSWQPLTESPNTSEISNLYLADGLLSGSTTPTLVSAAAAPVEVLFPPPYNSSFPPATQENLQGLAKFAFFEPSFDAASTDLTHVLFESAAGLTADAHKPSIEDLLTGGFKPELYEYSGGAVRLAGRIPPPGDTECNDAGAPACQPAPSSRAGIAPFLPGRPAYAGGMISADGSRSFFQAPQNTAGGKVYMREDGTRTVQLNVSEKTARESPGTAQLLATSSDGSRAFFATSEGLVNGDDGGENDLYMYDANAPAGSRLTLVSRSQTGEPHAFVSVIGASGDGHYVYFVTTGQLIAGEPANPTAGIYVWHDGQLAYIGTFSDVGEATLNSLQGMSGLSANPNTPKTALTARVTPDGRHLLFMSRSDAGLAGRGGFTGYDQGAGDCGYENQFGCRELYVYGADTGRLVCASCNPSGRIATAVALTDLTIGGGDAGLTAHLSHAISDDGRRVFFSTAEALVPGDTNNTWDAYEYDVPSGTVHLLSSGTDPSPSYFMDASASGDDAYFVTRRRLVGWDTDESYDLYDARVGGGLPEPAPSPPPCSGDACHGALAAPSAAPSFASGAYSGAGNLTPSAKPPPKPPACRRGFVRRRVHGRTRCVRRTGRHVHRATHARVSAKGAHR